MAKVQVQFSRIVEKLLLPNHWWKIATAGSTRTDRVRDDAQLALYSKILGSGFLHYGYFESPDISADNISFRCLKDAQQRYADLLIEQIVHKKSEVLDVGCGIGGLAKMLDEKGFQVTALTPDRRQVEFVATRYPSIPIRQCKYEELPLEENRNRFGTVIMSESFQYIHMDTAFALTANILKEGGTWVICDYFRIGDAQEKSGHRRSEFLKKLADSQEFTIIKDMDITPNVLPTLTFVDHMWNSLGLPLLEYADEKLLTKKPRLHYLFADLLTQVREGAGRALESISPSKFKQTKEYRLVVLERKQKTNH